MSITKLKTFGRWALPPINLHQVGPTLGGRRILTGMLTGGATAYPDDHIIPTRPAAEVGHVTPKKHSGR